MRGCLKGRMMIESSFSTLHGEHAATTLSQAVWPPWLLGTTWSNVRSADACLWPQYCHLNRSLRNTLNLVKATWRGAGEYFRSATTDGILMVVEGLRTTVSYSATTAWVSS